MTYAHHAALNLGIALSALWWGILPPQAHHTPAELHEMRRGSTWSWFRYGLGVGSAPTG